MLTRRAFERLAATAPEIESRLVRNLLSSTSRILERLSTDALAGGA